MDRVRTWRPAAAAALLTAWACGGLRAGVSVSPAYVEVKLDQGRPAGTFRIGNNGDKEERYRLEASFFTFGPNRDLQRPESSPHSLAPWLTFNPKELVLPPNTTRVVRFVVIPRGQLAPGEYWAGMEIVSLQTRTSLGKDDKGREFKIEVVPSVLVPIFGTVGEIQYKGGCSDLFLKPSPEGPLLGLTLLNQGRGRLLTTVDYKLLDPAGKPLAQGQLGKSYVFRESQVHLANTLKPATPLPRGDYKVDVTMTAPQLKQPIQLSRTLHWDPPPATRPTSRPASRPASAPVSTTRPLAVSPSPAQHPTLQACLQRVSRFLLRASCFVRQV